MTELFYLSLDIGCNNMAYAYFKNKDLIKYDLYSLDEDKKRNELIIHHRINRLIQLIESFDTINKIIVEKQFNTNTKAMSIMYSIATISKIKNIECIIYDPKDKFKYWNIPIDTKNKNHKKESIKRCPVDLSMYKKQDDLADAINQGLIYIQQHPQNS